MISLAHVIAKSVTTADNSRPDIVFVLLSHDKIHLIWNTTFRLLTASLLHVVARHYISWWSVVIGAFRSGYCFHVPWFPHPFAGFSCVVGLDVSFLKASMLPVFMLFGLGLM